MKKTLSYKSNLSCFITFSRSTRLTTLLKVTENDSLKCSNLPLKSVLKEFFIVRSVCMMIDKENIESYKK